MSAKPVTYTIPASLNIALHRKVKRGRMSQFVTQALWDALKKEDEALLKEFLEADADPGNSKIKQEFSALEGEDFVGLSDFDFGEK